MTITSSDFRNAYTGNGSTTVFAYTYQIADASHLTVTLVSTAGVESVTTAYTVSGVGNAGGGNVTMTTAPASGVGVVITRNQPFQQNTDYVTGEAFSAETHEAALDELTMNDIQQQEVLTRAVKAPVQDGAIGELPNITNRKNKIFAFDANGDPETSVLTADLANLFNNFKVGSEISGYSTVVESHQGSEFDGANKITLSQTYTPGNSNLFVFRNGQLLKKGASFDYTETSSTEVTLTYDPNDDDTYLFVVGVLSSAGSIDASNVTYTPAGSGAVSTNVQDKLRESVSVTDFGAVGDGVTDDSSSIQAAIDYAETINAIVYLPPGNYYIATGLTIDGGASIEGCPSGLDSSRILVDASVLHGVTVGSGSLFTGALRDFTVHRTAYSGGTENTGFRFVDVTGCQFETIRSYNSKYNFYMNPADGNRVAYCTWINILASGGLYNISGAISGSGYFNENVFLGGRLVTTSDTDTNIYIDFNCNHNRFIGVSCEGAGTQAIYINGTTTGGLHSCSFDNCRTEGTWSADDIVIGANTQRNLVIGYNLYTTVTDTGLSNSYILSTGSTIKNAGNGNTALTVERNALPSGTPALEVNDLYSSSGDSYGILIKSGRDTSGGYIMRAIRASDSLERFSIDSNGRLYTGINVETGESAWNFDPLKLGAYVLWVDATGDLRIKNGSPTSDTDGTIVGTQS
jgi:hypothetical protein